ncbi:MAG TPA: NAD-dependent epimerase/dehydratase family protein [archaeon]|nr:NAD-dependent epimerase/dehydratase family protein [archaeon]
MLQRIRKYLVTGGKGFIGSNLVSYLETEGQDVYSFDLRDGFDISSQEQLKAHLEGVHAVFHLAGMISVQESIASPEKARSYNVEGTKNVLNAALSNHVPKLVFPSSAAVYGNNPVLPKTEDSVLAPESPYASTKLEAEELLLEAGKGNGLHAVILRLFNVYGPRQNPTSQYSAVIPKFITNALQGKDLVVFGDGTQTRDFVFVNDVCRAMLLAADVEKANNQVINIGTGHETSLNELAELIISLTNSNSKVLRVAAKPSEVRRSVADVSRAKKVLGWKPKYSLEKGLEETIRYFSTPAP